MGLEELRLWPPGPQYPESLNPKARMPRTLLYCTRMLGHASASFKGSVWLCASHPCLDGTLVYVLLIQIVHTGSSCIAASGDVEKENEHGNADGSTISRHGTVAGVRLR